VGSRQAKVDYTHHSTKLKPPEMYKGKGIDTLVKSIRKKEVKTAAA
jgi:hypothetical protein